MTQNSNALGHLFTIAFRNYLFSCLSLSHEPSGFSFLYRVDRKKKRDFRRKRNFPSRKWNNRGINLKDHFFTIFSASIEKNVWKISFANITSTRRLKKLVWNSTKSGYRTKKSVDTKLCVTFPRITYSLLRNINFSKGRLNKHLLFDKLARNVFLVDRQDSTGSSRQLRRVCVSIYFSRKYVELTSVFS